MPVKKEECLNKTCLKDEFPLPNIDMLVDVTSSWTLDVSFIDDFNLLQSDQDGSFWRWKTAFRTPNGNFHYVVMPFGLKNDGATYHEL